MEALWFLRIMSQFNTAMRLFETWPLLTAPVCSLLCLLHSTILNSVTYLPYSGLCTFSFFGGGGGARSAALGILVPNQGLNPCPRQWKRGVLTIGPPGNYLNILLYLPGSLFSWLMLTLFDIIIIFYLVSLLEVLYSPPHPKIYPHFQSLLHRTCHF